MGIPSASKQHFGVCVKGLFPVKKGWGRFLSDVLRVVLSDLSRGRKAASGLGQGDNGKKRGI
jgi:hypothetical protein